MMTKHQNPNARFTKIIVIEALFWVLGGLALCYFMSWSAQPYLLVLGAALLGLLLLGKIVQVLLNPNLPGGFKVMQFVFFSFFKLVCLALLAITLKRFHELSSTSVVVAASFYWVAPVTAGLLCSKD